MNIRDLHFRRAAFGLLGEMSVSVRRPGAGKPARNPAAFPVL
jgi:hypothetical protein